MVTADVAMDDHVLCGFIRDSLREMACRTLVTPWPMSSLTRKRIISSESIIPRAGNTSAIKLNPPLLTMGKTKFCMSVMSFSSSTAAQPEPMPVAKLSRRSFALSEILSLGSITRRRRRLRLRTARYCRRAECCLPARCRGRHRKPGGSRRLLHLPASALYLQRRRF